MKIVDKRVPVNEGKKHADLKVGQVYHHRASTTLYMKIPDCTDSSYSQKKNCVDMFSGELRVTPSSSDDLVVVETELHLLK